MTALRIIPCLVLISCGLNAHPYTSATETGGQAGIEDERDKKITVAESVPNVKTITEHKPDGAKNIFTTTLLGDECYKIDRKYVDGTGNVVKFTSEIKKGSYDLQITEDSIVRNIIYTDTPCSFSLVDPFSGDKTAFSFNGKEDRESIECERIARNFPKQVCEFIQIQAASCRRYKEYVEYIEWLKGWENIIECIEDTAKCPERF